MKEDGYGEYNMNEYIHKYMGMYCDSGFSYKYNRTKESLIDVTSMQLKHGHV